MLILKFSYYLLTLLIVSSCTFKPTVAKSESYIFESSVPSIVVVYAFNNNSELIGQGTGFVITSSGLIATNFHVIDKSHSLRVAFTSGEKYDVKEIIAIDEHRDIALINIHGYDLSPLKLGNSNSITVGEKVIAIGNPLGLSNTLSSGIISGIRTDLEDYKLIQTTTPISPGSSGGPLINMDGEVVGLTTAYLEGGQNLNFVVPVNYLIALKNQGSADQVSLISPQDLEIKKELAGKYYNDEEYEAAAELFFEIVAIDNTDPVIYFKLGYCLHRIAVDLGPHNSNDPAWEDYANSAIDNFRMSVKLDPSNEYGFLKISRVYGLWMIDALQNKNFYQFKEALKNAQQSGGFFPFVLESNRAVLSSCSNNSILFTNGDDDTFPVWYLQEIENVRNDVTVVNLSLLNSPFYVKYLKNFKNLDFNISDDDIDKMKIKEWPRPREEIVELITEDTQQYFNVDRMSLNVYHSYIDEDWEYLSVADQLILLIINNYINEKDIYFVNGISWLNYSVPFSLYNYSVSEGLVNKVVAQPKNRTQSYSKWEDNLMNNYSYTLLSDPRIFGENISYNFIHNYRHSFNDLAKIYKYRGEKTKVKEILDFKDTVIPENNIPIPWDDLVDIYDDGDIVKLYDFAGIKNTSFTYLDSISESLIENRYLPAAVDSPYYYYKIADFYYDMSDYENSYNYIKEYLKYEPSSLKAQKYLMYINFALGNDASGISIGNQLLEDDPENLILISLLGDQYMNNEQYDEAMIYYDRALNINDQDYGIYNAYGLLYLYQSKHSLAIENFQKVLDFAPKYSATYKYALENIAETYIAMREDEKAIEIYYKLIETDPTMCLAYSKLAILYYRQEKLELSNHLLQIAHDNMWSGNYGQLGLACYYSYINDVDTALKYLKTALNMDFSDISWLKYDPHLDNLRATKEFWEAIDNK